MGPGRLSQLIRRSNLKVLNRSPDVAAGSLITETFLGLIKALEDLQCIAKGTYKQSR